MLKNKVNVVADVRADSPVAIRFPPLQPFLEILVQIANKTIRSRIQLRTATVLEEQHDDCGQRETFQRLERSPQGCGNLVFCRCFRQQ